MEKIAEMEVAIPNLSATLDKWSAVFVEMTAAMVKSGEEVAASDARGGGMAAKLAIANHLAASLNDCCDEHSGGNPPLQRPVHPARGA